MDPNNEIQFDTAWEGVNRHFPGLGSEHPGGANVAMADTYVQFVRNTSFDSVPWLGVIFMRESDTGCICQKCPGITYSLYIQRRYPRVLKASEIGSENTE